MKPRLSTKHNAAMTLFEVGIVVAIAIILVVIFLPRAANKHSPEVVCSNNLKQIGLAYRIWAGDNSDLLPMGVAITNGGSMELIATGDAATTFQVMSNELSMPKILVCPADARSVAMDFSKLTRVNISYLAGVDVTNEDNPQMVLSGDGNFELGGVPVKSGLQSFWTNDPVTWSAARHIRRGNLGRADGSVETFNNNRLHDLFVETEFVTNRLAIP